jgi:hypothetical protein
MGNNSSSSQFNGTIETAYPAVEDWASAVIERPKPSGPLFDEIGRRMYDDFGNPVDPAEQTKIRHWEVRDERYVRGGTGELPEEYQNRSWDYAKIWDTDVPREYLGKSIREIANPFVEFGEDIIGNIPTITIEQPTHDFPDYNVFEPNQRSLDQSILDLLELFQPSELQTPIPIVAPIFRPNRLPPPTPVPIFQSQPGRKRPTKPIYQPKGPFQSQRDPRYEAVIF